MKALGILMAAVAVYLYLQQGKGLADFQAEIDAKRRAAGYPGRWHWKDQGSHVADYSPTGWTKGDTRPFF